MPDKSFQYDSIREGYYDKIFHEKKGIRSGWHHAKFEFVKKNINKKNKHLDIGCGPGTFVSILSNEKSFGIDISKNQIKYAKKKYSSKNKKFFLYKNKLPFKNNSLDSISIIELVEHLPLKKINKLLNNCHKCLKKGGEIYITTPNYLSLWPVLEIILNMISDVTYEDQHITKFNRFSIDKIINKKKFQIKYITSFLLVAPFLSFFYFSFYRKFSFIDKLLTFIFPGYLVFIKIKKI
tara:strand:+ start:64 stop:774 length:711 start_codon:yes stop_codon:yes gene_type:complete